MVQKTLFLIFFDHQRCVAKSRNYHIETFVPYHGATQGGIIMSPTFFNVIVDAVIRKWYADVMEDVTAANTGL